MTISIGLGLEASQVTNHSSKFCEGPVDISINLECNRNFVCESKLGHNCSILGYLSGDCVDGNYVETRGIVFLPFNGRDVCFEVLELAYSEFCQVISGILGFEFVETQV